MVESKVVLPAALGPSKATILPSFTSRLTSPERLEIARSMNRPFRCLTSWRLLAQIRRDDALVTGHFVGRPACDEHALVHDQNPFGYGHHGVHQVLDEQDGHAAVAGPDGSRAGFQPPRRGSGPPRPRPGAKAWAWWPRPWPPRCACAGARVRLAGILSASFVHPHHFQNLEGLFLGLLGTVFL